MSSRSMLPYFTSGIIVKGFGRGSKSLGIPTANFSTDVVEALPPNFELGIYYGWAALESKIYKMVMSIGWNPFYKNEKKSMEVHMLHKFENDLHGKHLKVAVIGYIRPELDFTSVEDLIETINNDIKIADKCLDEPQMIACFDIADDGRLDDKKYTQFIMYFRGYKKWTEIIKIFL